jgi:hypothetical protein
MPRKPDVHWTFCGSSPDPSKEVAAEILRRHRNEEKEPWLASLLASLVRKLFRSTPPSQEPPKWPLTGVRQPLGRGPRPRSGAVALKEPW